MNPSRSPLLFADPARRKDDPTLGPSQSALSRLADLIRPLPQAHLAPRTFFLARAAVFTLAFSGFPASLLRLKEALTQTFPDLAPEQPGSRWPKISLGALQPEASLEVRDIRLLLDVCEKWRPALNEFPPVLVDALSVVVYRCPSLEQRRHTFRIPLGGGPPDPHDVPPPEHVAYVEDVLRQFTPEHLPQYLPALFHRDHDARHYREPTTGATLVYDLPPGTLPLLDEFTRAVDRILPGVFSWFSQESRHVTIRRLTPLRL